MDHGLELFIPILEILEIEVCNILQNPGNIVKRIFLIPHILEILDRTIHIQSNISRLIDNVEDLNFQYFQDRTD